MQNNKLGIRRVILVLALALVPIAATAEQTPDRFDGLKPVPDAKVDMAYVDPDADFSTFNRVAILDAFVAFRANWERDKNRSRSRNLRSADV